MASASNIQSIVEYVGAQRERHCGYCKSGDQNRFTHGMWAHSMTPQVYQDLLDRGWRRSGHYCYKPTMDKTCCPQYTIRCDALHFHPSRSQKRVIRRMNAFLASGVMPKRSAYDIDVDHPKKKDVKAKNSVTGESEPKESMIKVSGQQAAQEVATGSGKQSAKPEDGVRRQGKAKFRRQQRKLEKLRAKGITIDSFPPRPPPPPKSLENFLSFTPDSSTNCLKVKGAKHTLEIRLVRSSPPSQEFTNTFSLSAALYVRYQEIIHNDPSTEDGFKRFLVDSPLEVADGADGDPSQFPGCGSFHQQYWLDDKLIAVGVLDILPHCISSKYFFYDPDYRPLALGVYSALQEVALVRRLQQHAPDLRYYYMGFYIHTCPKMRYKGRYRPSDLLCPETYTWHPIEQCQKKLDVTSYCRFDESGAGDPDGEVEHDNLPVLFRRKLLPYQFYKLMKYKRAPSAQTDEAEVAEYARLIGKKAAPAVMLYRSAED